MELNINDYVLIKENINLNLSQKDIFEQKRPLKIYSLNVGLQKAYVGCLKEKTNYSTEFPILIPVSNLIKITNKEKEKLLINLNKFEKKKNDESKARLKPKHISILKRPIESVITKKLLLTELNSVIIIPINYLKSNNFKIKDNINIEKIGGSCDVTCCSFTRGNGDILIYIPKSWLNYFGYSLTDLKSWITFLSKVGIGYKGTYIKTTTLKRVFDNRCQQRIVLNKDNYNDYKDINEDCYEIGISHSDSRNNYLNFILTRYIYSNKYWNIPYIAMKLKRNMKSLTHWECLLLANCFQDYDSYYSLTSIHYKALPLPSKSNTIEEIFKKYKRGLTTLNGAFKQHPIDKNLVRNYIKNENYRELENLIKKYRDVID